MKIGMGVILGLMVAFMLAPIVSADTLTVCPSGCNFTVIQDAIDNASSGDTIEVGAGSYTGDLVINTSLTLQGEGANVTTIMRNASTSQVVLIQADNVTINGFKIDGGSAPYQCSNLVKLSTTGSPPYNNIEVSDCHLLHSKGAVIMFYGDPPAGFNASSGYTINDNTIEYYAGDSCDAGGCQYRGIAVGKTLNLEIKRNNITNSNSWEYRSDNFSYGGYAIYLKDYSGGVVEDNVISKCAYGIIVNSIVEETWVNNNTITECHRGIVTGEVFAKVHITNNTVSTRRDPNNPVDAKNVNEQGILLGGDGDFYDSSPPYDYQVDNLQHEVSGNTVTGTATTDSFGLGVMAGWWDEDYGASGIFTNNTVNGYKYGIKVWGTYAPYAGSTENMTGRVHALFINNSISNTTLFAVVDSIWSGVKIDIVSNWWGSATPDVSKIDGDNYTYYPFCLNAGCTQETEFCGCDTTNWTAVTNWSAVDLVLDGDDGNINWTGSVDLNGSCMLFDAFIQFSYRSISVNTTAMSELDQPATLTFKGAGFGSLEQFTVFRNGAVCPSSICSNVRIVGNDVLVDVTQLSDYDLNDTVMVNYPILAVIPIVVVAFLLMGLFGSIISGVLDIKQIMSLAIAVMIAIIMVGVMFAI